MSHYGMIRESEGSDKLLDYFRQEGVPQSLIRDNAKMQASKAWNDYLRIIYSKMMRLYAKTKKIKQIENNFRKALLAKIIFAQYSF